MKTPTTDRYKYRRTPVKNRNTKYDTGIYALAAAIVKQAVDDYQEADRLLAGTIRYSSTNIVTPKKTQAEVVKFFRSQWYGTLCDIDPNRILRKLGVRA